MGLEATDTINGLVASNPDALDEKSQGDDHIRLIKNVLKRTFPGMNGPFLDVTVLAGDYTLQATDMLKFFAIPSGSPTITLPSAQSAGFTDMVCMIGSGSTGTVTLVCSGTESINGLTSFTLLRRDRILLISQASANGWTAMHVMDYRNTRTEDMLATRPRLTSARESIVSNGAVTGGVSVNINEATFIVWTLTGDVSLNISGAVPGLAHAVTFVLTQDTVGGHQVTWPGSVKWPGGVTPVLSGPGKVDVVTLVTWDGGTSYLAFLGGQNF